MGVKTSVWALTETLSLCCSTTSLCCCTNSLCCCTTSLYFSNSFLCCLRYGIRKTEELDFFCSSLKARNDFIRTLHRTMHEKYDTARRISSTGQQGQGHTVQSPRCAQHQQLKPSNPIYSMETGHQLRSRFLNSVCLD